MVAIHRAWNAQQRSRGITMFFEALSNGTIGPHNQSRITNSPIAHLAIVWAKVPQENNTIRGFILENVIPA